jgi:hypothetical protein
VNKKQLKRMRPMGLALAMGVGLCALIVWDQTRPADEDGARTSREQATMSQPAEPAGPPASDATPAENPGVSAPSESGATDGEVRTLVM